MNKEEIEESKKCLEETIQNCYAELKAIKLNNLRKYIQQLENKVKEQEESRQAVVDYLKKEIDTMGSGPNMYLVKTALKVVLNMLEGEKK